MVATSGVPYWNLVHSPSGGGSSTTIANVQEVNLSVGRRVFSDPFRTGTVEIRGRRPDLMPSMSVGDLIRCDLRMPSGASYVENIYQFRLSDYVVDYGITSALDTWTMTLEDAFATLGRATISTTIASGTDTRVAAGNICSSVGVSFGYQSGTSTTSRAVTITNENALEVLQTLANTEQALVTSTYGNTVVWVPHTKWTSGNTGYPLVTFADDGTGLKFDRVTFAGLADLYSQYIVNNVVGSSPVVTGSGVYSFGFQSYQIDATAATDNNKFLQALFSLVTQKIYSISFLVNQQDSAILNAIYPDQLNRVAVKFRGTTYEGVMLGYNINSSLEETRAEVFVVPLAATNFLTLNDSTLGKLDSNKLGW